MTHDFTSSDQHVLNNMVNNKKMYLNTLGKIVHVTDKKCIQVKKTLYSRTIEIWIVLLRIPFCFDNFDDICRY